MPPSPERRHCSGYEIQLLVICLHKNSQTILFNYMSIYIHVTLFGINKSMMYDVNARCIDGLDVIMWYANA